VGQAADEVERRSGTKGWDRADGLGGVERERPGQHGEPAVRDPLVGGGEAVAPVDLLVQVPLPGRPAAQPGQRARFATEAVGDLGEGEGSHPGRGELDPQRQTVHGRADAGERRAVRPVDLGRLTPGPGPFEEQRDRRARRERVGGVGDGQRERSQLLEHLAVDSQGLAARGEHRDRRRGLDECLDGGRDSLDDLLAVVQQQEHRPFGGEVAQRVEGCPARAGVEAESGGHAAGDPFDGTRVGVGDRRQVHEPHAVGEQVAHVVGGRDREACLAAPTGTDDRDDPALRELGRDTAALVVPTHEPCAPPGQVYLDRPRLVGHDHRSLRRHGRSEQRRVVGEDPLVQPPQLRPRLDTKLVGEHPA
jgi:hypothetical protein